MSVDAYVLLGLTLLIGVLLMVVVYALVRFRTAARGAWRDRHAGPESALMVGAVQEAVLQLRDEGRQMRVRAEASERLSDQIVGNMTSGLLLVDVDGCVRTVNPAGRRLLGLRPEVTGHFQDLLTGHAALRRVIKEALHDGKPLARRTVRSDAAETATILELTVSPVPGSQGELQAVICLFDDVTAVLALEDQLRLKDSLARLGELTAGIAHEFRNGLATIHGYARLMDPAILPPPHPIYLQGIRDGTVALGQVVTNFLNFARPVPLTLTTVDLGGLAGKAADEIRNEIESGGGQVEVCGTFPLIDGDEVMLRQAFSNLCRNAAEACCASRHPGRISIVGTSTGEGCRVTITDNGTGIEPGALERIFHPFFTTRVRGTGLGLAIVRKVVVTHNGRVTATNCEGGGAVFEVVLPLQQASRSA